MGRPRKTLRPIPLNVSLDEDIAIKMKQELHSDLEGKIPHGAQSRLINQVLRKYFKSLAARRVEMARREAAGEIVAPKVVDKADLSELEDAYGSQKSRIEPL